MRLTLVLLMLVLPLLLAGCGTTQPSKFYILSPVPSGGPATVTDQGPVVGLGPVTLPKYLDRPQIVQRSGHNQLLLSESHRWAEPLTNNFIRVLAENLSVSTPTKQVALYPWNRSTRIDYQVSVDVMRFDADTSGDAELSAAWTVRETKSGEIIFKGRSTLNQPALAPGYAAIAAGQSRLLAAFAREIAGVIRAAAGASD